MVESNIIIEAKNITTIFGKNTVHDDISFSINQGEIFGLLGGSGSGKSTLLREMILLQKLTSGSLKVLGHEVLNISVKEQEDLQKSWGVLFQFGALFSSLSVLENVMIPLMEYTKLPKKLIEEIALMRLDMVGLPNKAAYLNPSELSGGMKKRAALARALALDPKLLFLDEPTSGLDPKSARVFDELILTLQSTLSLSVIVVTHDKDTIKTVLDNFIILGSGKIIFNGDYASMRANPSEAYKDFLE